MNKKPSRLASIIALLLLIGSQIAEAASTPNVILYEGRLLDSSSEAITTAHDFRFSFWKSADNASGDISVAGALNTLADNYGGWNGEQTITPNSNGIFTAELGSGTTLPTIDFDSHKYLMVEVKASGAADTAYEVIDPDTANDLIDRMTIGSLPYAKQAKNASGTTLHADASLSSSGTLAVEGQCVTGDSLLRVKAENLKPSAQEAYTETPIKEIAPGALIQSFDEKTGRLVWSRVNVLLDMGVKPIYKLTTKSGKIIRTTGNHPYFVMDKPIAVPPFAGPMTPSSILSERSVTNSECQRHDGNGDKSKTEHNIEEEKVFAHDEGRVMLTANDQATIAINTPDTTIFQEGDASEIPGRNGMTMDAVEIWPMPTQISATLFQCASNSFGEEPLRNNIGADASDSFDSLQGKWKKVYELQEGQFIAVAGADGKAKWDAITAIDLLPPEQVYDIEVQGTHNFVANGIIAHNTYLQGASTFFNTAIFNEDSGAVNFRIESDNEQNMLFVDGTNDRIGIGTASPETALDVTGTISGSLITQNGSGDNYFMGNLGIGTTSPGAALEVKSGDVLLSKEGTAIDGTNYPSRDIILRASGWDTNNSIARSGDWNIRNSAVSTTYPDFDLHFIQPSGESAMIITGRGSGYSEGFVGIGTYDPIDQLDINGGNSDRAIVIREGSIGARLLLDAGANSFVLQAKTLSGNYDTISIPYYGGSIGNVGIGLNDPGEKLSVAGNMMIGDSGWSDGTTTGDLAIQGNVGIGTTDPGEKLEITGTASGRTLHAQDLLTSSGSMTVEGGSRFGSGAYLFGHLIPGTDDSYDLGTSANRWRELFLSGGTLHLGGPSDEAEIGFDPSLGSITFDSDDDGTAEMVVDDSGNVGIGTTSPGAKLEVTSSGTEGFVHFNSNAGDLIGRFNEESTGDGAFHILDPTSGDIKIRLNPRSDRDSWITDGNVGIGTTGPETILELSTDSNPLGFGDGIGITYANSVSNNRPVVNFRRAKGSKSSPTAVGNGDVLGSFTFSGYDGSNYLAGSTIRSDATGSAGTKQPSNLEFWTSNSSSENVKMLIDSNGNVGIGTTNPGTKLDVVGTMSGSAITDSSGGAYTGAAVCYLADGVMGHCTTADASSCGCTAN